MRRWTVDYSGSLEQRPVNPEDKANPTTHYVVVRKDLPLGILAANVVHAAGESSPGFLPAGTYAVVLAVPDEPALVKLAARLYRAGLPFVTVLEPDPPWSGQMMAIGVVPARKEALRKHLSSIPLLR